MGEERVCQEEFRSCGESLRQSKDVLEQCRLCPRECGVNRSAGQQGRCRTDATVRIARAALHMWEEPCLSGTEGSGAVFFSGCSLGCIYCQNHEISGGEAGLAISTERLAEIFLELQEEGANNINLVTAGHYIPQVCDALERSKRQGLSLPIVYNSSGYEKVESLKCLEGLVDIYLPDLKYLDRELAARYSHAPDYPEYATAALAEMVRQQPKVRFRAKQESGDIRRLEGDLFGVGEQETGVPGSHQAESGMQREQVMEKGVIVRHLLLPGHVREAKHVVEYLYRTYGDQIYISLMNQYTPIRTDFADKNLNRRVTRREYQRLLDFAVELGVTNGFCQEGATASESFIPAFNYEGVLEKEK